MTHTLFEITHRVVSELGEVFQGVATGGTTTTLIDTDGLTDFPDDAFNTNGKGTLWLLHDAGGVGAAPEGEWGRVSDFVQSTSTATMEALTVAPAASDIYAIASPRYRLQNVIAKVNIALTKMGKIKLEDISLSVSGSLTEYTLPLARMNVTEVEIAGQETVDDYEWRTILDWDIQKTAKGTADELIFKVAQTDGATIRLTYYQEHPRIYAATDTLDDQISIEAVVAHTKLELLKERIYSDKGQELDRNLSQQLEFAQAEADKYGMAVIQLPRIRPAHHLKG